MKTICKCFKLNKSIILTFYFLFLTFYLASLIQAQERSDVISPQYNMVGARVMSMGALVPTITDDINGVFLNPAAIGDVGFVQVGLTNQTVLDEFDYKVFNMAAPYGDFVWGLSYGSDFLYGIPETRLTNGAVYATGETFSSGFHVLQASVAQSVDFDFFYFDKLSYGFGFKALQQVLSDEARESYGVDAGIVATFFFPGDFGIDRAHIGASVVNLVSTPLPKWSYTYSQTRDPSQTSYESDENPVARQLFLGGGVDMFEDAIKLNLGLTGISELDEISVGGEYKMFDTLLLRGGVLTDTSEPYVIRYSLGTGLFFDRIAGFGYDEYSMRLDYNYTMYPYPFDEEAIHSISLSFLGEARNVRPTLITPRNDFITKKTFVRLRGMADRYAEVRIFNNDSQSRSVKADKFGRWKYEEFPLIEGKNNIYLRSSTLGRDISYKTDPVEIISDTTAPTFTVTIATARNKNNLVIKVHTSEYAARVEGMIDKNRFGFRRLSDNEYEHEFGLSGKFRDRGYIAEKISTVSVNVWDRVNNAGESKIQKFFLAFITPKDKMVYYGNKMTAVGSACQAIDELWINGEKATLDRNYAFSHTIVLKYGKNMLKIKAFGDNKQEYSYYARILAIHRFNDIPKTFKGKRDIELLATMGFVDARPDGKFYPNQPMNRLDLTRFLVKIRRIELRPVEFPPFLDVAKDATGAPYIQAAIEEGLMFAYPDGTFRPNQTITVEDAYNILINNEIIDTEEVIVDQKPITRAEFTLLLKDMKDYERMIQYLIDWEKGYKRD